MCDGSTVTWGPQLEDTECGECGHVTGQIDRAEPLFHGTEEKRGDDWYCSRCDALIVGMRHLKIVMDRIRPRIIAGIEKSNAFYAYMRGTRRG